MKSIYNAKLLDLIPENLRNDPDLMAACEMEDRSFFMLADLAKKVLILPNIDDLDEAVLDNLSWQLNVDFYEADLDLEKKRDLIRSAIKFHISKGTAGAVEDMLSVVFDTSYIEEWFDYGGEPYMFRIRTTDVVEQDKYDKMRLVVDTVKNSRSHLESFIVERQKTLPMMFGTCVHFAKKVTIGARV